MPIYRIHGIWTASKCLGEFEADTPEEAIALAENSEENYAVLCHQCANEIELNDYSAERFEAEEV